jgi:hypothetical protein
MAKSGDPTAGGSTFVTDATGRGPGNVTNWSDLSAFVRRDVKPSHPPISA